MASDMVFRRGCGQPIHVLAVTCPHCGAPQKTVLRERSPSKGSKSRATAAILAFLLGGLGAHKFYLGQIAAGILYLLFFWTLIPGIIAFIEFIILLTMSDETFHEKYG